MTLIVGLYLPTVSARFDFVDDGNLVYPAASLPPAARARLTWEKVEANHAHLGPFRPVLWAHWDVQAELLGADELRWRLARLAWMGLATAVFLWLLRELRIESTAAVTTGALAMWSPAPNEIWRSLTLSEGVAMPYALGALVCALRAGRSARPWRWDVAGIACALAALGCKNTFAAIVPAQLLLRVAPDGEPLAAALRARGPRAAVLALPLLLPIVHLAIFMRAWHPGQYAPGLPSWPQLGRMFAAVQSGISLGVMAPGLLAAAVALAAAAGGASASPGRFGWRGVAGAIGGLCHRYRVAGRAGAALLLGGIAVYLPLDGVAGRYAIPAVWGALLWIAALLSGLVRIARAADARTRRLARTAFVLLALGLAAVAVESLLRQDKSAARSALLWQALELLERRAEPGAVIAWRSGPDLSIGEGVHFLWHLRGRGHDDLGVALLAADGRVAPRSDVPALDLPPTFLVAAPSDPPDGGDWSLLRRLERSYRGGMHRYVVEVWRRPTP